MMKKVLFTILILLGVAGLGGSYLWFVGQMERSERAKVVCSDVQIAVKGDGSNLIGTDDILEIIGGRKGIVGIQADSVDLCTIEQKISACGEILDSRTARCRSISATVTQRCGSCVRTASSTATPRVTSSRYATPPTSRW